MPFRNRRAVFAVFVALSAIAATPAPAGKTPGIASEVLSDRSHMEEDLRFLTDENGGRPTGSAAYEAALKWGEDAFRRPGVDVVRLEDYEAPSRREEISAKASVTRR
ncbi:MAG TPA: hypothetical protein VGB47_11300 [Thermoanaerobaculia bacterium]|jgi:hypothetical protein